MEHCDKVKEIELMRLELFGNGSGGGILKKMARVEEKFNGLAESYTDTKMDIKDIKSSINALLLFKTTETLKGELGDKFIEEKRKDRKWFIVTSISMIGIFVTLIGIIIKLL